MLRAVMFDAVGTLIQPSPAAAEVYHRVAARHGSRRSAHEIRQRFGEALQIDATVDRGSTSDVTSEAGERARWLAIVGHTCDDLGAALPHAFAELWDHFAQPAHWKLYADVIPAWQSLPALGLSCGIASNLDQRLERLCAEIWPLNTAIGVFHSAQLHVRKPHREFFDQIAARQQLAPSQLVMVGDDRQADYQGAIAAGWRAVWLDRSAETQPTRDNCIRSLLELPAILAEIR